MKTAHDIQLFSERLSGFIDELRRDGFNIGAGQYIAAQELLLALLRRGELSVHPALLAGKLAPLFCGRREEQESFHRRYRAWLRRFEDFQPEDSVEGINLEEGGAEVRRIDRRLSPWRWVGLFAGLLLLMLAVIFLIDYLRKPKAREVRVNGMVVTADSGRAVPDAILELAGDRKVSDSLGHFAFSFTTADSQAGLRLESTQYVLASPLEVNLIDPPDTLRVEVMAWSPPPPDSTRTEAPPDRITITPAVFQPPAVPESASFWQTYRNEIRYGVLLLPLLFFLVWWLRYLDRRQLVLERRPAPRGEPLLRRIRLESAPESLFRGVDFRVILQRLHLHRTMASRQLDGPASVAATLDRGGLFAPVYAARQALPEYLVLVDRAGFRDQQAGLIDALFDRLEEESIFCARYYFRNDPRFCTAEDGTSVSLFELTARHPQHRLLIFSDARGCFDPVSGRAGPWLEQLEAWPERALFTPAALSEWGYREWTLAREGLMVLPAGRAGLAHFIETLQRGREEPLPRQAVRPGYPALLRERERRWLERDAPNPQTIRELLQQLRAYLGEDGYYWLQACAVYPELRWELTLYFGRVLNGGDDAPLIGESRLFALTRLPWFRQGYMPDWLRLALLEGMNRRRGRRVRTVLQQLLLSAVARPREGFDQEIALPLPLFSRQRWRGVLGALLRRAPADSPLQDYIFLGFFSRGRFRLLTPALPPQLRRLLFPRGQAVLGLRPLAGVVLAVLMSAMIFTMFPVMMQEAVPRDQGIETNFRIVTELRWGNFKQQNRNFQHQGYRLGDIEAYYVDSIPYYAGVWHKDSTSQQVVWKIDGREKFEKTCINMTDLGFSIIDVEVYFEDNNRKFLGIWEANNDAMIFEVDLSWNQLIELYRQYGANEYQLTGIEPYVTSGEIRYVAIWKYDRQFIHRVWKSSSQNEFSAKWRDFGREGYRLFDVEIFRESGLKKYVGLWGRGMDNYGLCLEASWDSFRVQQRQFDSEGLYLVDLEVENDSIPLYSGVWRYGFSQLDEGAPNSQEGIFTNQHGSITSVAFHPDGELLASGGADGLIRLWNRASGDSLAVLRGHDAGITRLAFSPDRRLLASASRDRSVRLWDLQTYREVARLEGHTAEVLALAFRPDGRLLASGGADRTIRLWDPISLQETGRLEGHDEAVTSLAFGPSGSHLLASGSADQAVRLWDPGQSLPAGRLTGHSTTVNSVAFSPDGRWLASGATDRTIRLWDVPGRRLYREIVGHRRAVTALVFNDDGNLLASASEDSTIRLWAVPGGQPAALREDLPGQAAALAVRPDGRQLLSAAGEQLRLWDINRYGAPKMVLIPGGSFQMGSTDGDSDEQPVHAVTVSDFYLGKHEVTVKEFRKFVQAAGYVTDAEKQGGAYVYDENLRWEKKLDANWGNPYFNQDDDHPVVCVSWNDAVAYCNWRSRQDNLTPAYTISDSTVNCDISANGYRLPTEAEWEYAARSGSKGYKYSWGNGDPTRSKGGNIADESAKTKFSDWTIWEGYNDGYIYTAPVDKFGENDFGICNLSGNAWEWCWDWYDDNYYANSANQNPKGPSEGNLRVLRGGSWSINQHYVRAVYRDRAAPFNASVHAGFRLAKTH